VALLCALPFCIGCLRDRHPQAEPGANGGARELALFEAAAERAARAQAHTAVALAAGPSQLAWGVAVAAPTDSNARALALSRCATAAKLSGIAARCTLYAVDGQPLYREQN